MKVLILGYGEMGHAMEYLLAPRHELFFWDIKEEKDFIPVDLEKTVPIADIIIFCLPVNPHKQIAQRIEPLLSENCICLSIAKGLDEQGHTAAQIFESVLDAKHHYALIYGPMISEEILVNKYAFAQLGCKDLAHFEIVEQLFKGSKLKLEASADITGISWSVILKNVYAMIFGVADELNLGDNVRGYFAVSALRELDQIVRIMGGEETSPFHLAGLGDLITTATSASSHHHGIGQKLARGETEGITGEGVHTLLMVKKHNLFDIKPYPLFNYISQLIDKPKETKSSIKEYFENLK